jgi:predicted  nucleic acid-binding Zn-ribbon protein
MEITSFVLGMLTIVAAGISASIVVGLAKINQLTRKTESLQQLCAAIEGDLRREIENIYNNMSRKDEEIRRVISDTNRDITMVEKTIMNQIDQARQETGKAVHTVRTDLSSYVDSRIDKVVLKGSWEGSKQILKG